MSKLIKKNNNIHPKSIKYIKSFAQDIEQIFFTKGILEVEK